MSYGYVHSRASGGPLALIGFDAAVYTVNEAGGEVLLIVKRVGSTVGACSASFATTDGTALAGVDYGAASGAVSWADGDGADKTFSVPILLSESAHPVHFFAHLMDPSNATIDGSAATVVIEGIDSPPASLVFLESAEYFVTDIDRAASVVVGRTGTDSLAVTVETTDGTARAGQEYLAIPGGTILNWAANDLASQQVVVTVVPKEDLAFAFDQPGEFDGAILSGSGRRLTSIVGPGHFQFSGNRISFDSYPRSPRFGRIYFEVAMSGPGLVFDNRYLGANIDVTVGGNTLHFSANSGAPPNPFLGTQLSFYEEVAGIGGVVIPLDSLYVQPRIGVALDLDAGIARVGVELDVGSGVAMQWLVNEGVANFGFTSNFVAATGIPISSNTGIAQFSVFCRQNAGNFSDEISFEVFNAQDDLIYMPPGYAPWRSQTVYPVQFTVNLSDPQGVDLGTSVAVVEIQEQLA